MTSNQQREPDWNVAMNAREDENDPMRADRQPNQHSRLPITSLAEAQGYIEHLEEQLETLRKAATSAENDLRIHGTGPGVIGARHKLYEALKDTSNPATSSEADGRRLVSDLPDASDPATPLTDMQRHMKEGVEANLRGGAFSRKESSPASRADGRTSPLPGAYPSPSGTSNQESERQS